MRKIKTSFKFKRSIPIKGARYKIKMVKDLKDDDNKACWGLHDHIGKVISIEKSLDDKEKVQTLLHEIFHAYLFECNIREGLDSQLEEAIVESLAQCVDLHFELKWK